MWERVGASNPRWCRPISHLLILRNLLALLAGFPLGWLASDSSLLIPESQCLPPSAPEARVVILTPLCGRSILRRKGCEVEEGDRSPPPRRRAARPRPRACSRAPPPASPSFFSESAEDHIASLALLLRIVKRFPGGLSSFFYPCQARKSCTGQVSGGGALAGGRVWESTLRMPSASA